MVKRNKQWDTLVYRPEYAKSYGEPFGIIEPKGTYFLVSKDFDKPIFTIREYFTDRKWVYENSSEIVSKGLTSW